MHVITTVRIDDEAGATDKLIENIASVERALGHQLNRPVLVQSALA
jgi:hypothetical protein